MECIAEEGIMPFVKGKKWAKVMLLGSIPPASLSPLLLSAHCSYFWTIPDGSVGPSLIVSLTWFLVSGVCVSVCVSLCVCIYVSLEQ